MREETKSVAFARIDAWLRAHAPRTRAALEQAPSPSDLDAVARQFDRTLPIGLRALYASCGGQKAGSPGALLRGYFMLTLRGPDGMGDAWTQMREAAEAGAEWATDGRCPFAKDFAGSFLCVDLGDPERLGCVVEIDDGVVTVLAPDVESFLADTASGLESGTLTIDDTIEEVESFEVVFDASRERAPGDVVTHSVFTQLGIDAVVEPYEAHASPFDKEPVRHGFYVRLIPREGHVRVGSFRLEDGQHCAIPQMAGHGTGGGKAGFFVYVTSTGAPIPEGSRLYLTLERVRRV